MSDVLLFDLSQYKASKDKGIAMASRSLISLYREINPELLHKNDRVNRMKFLTAVYYFLGQKRQHCGSQKYSFGRKVFLWKK